jgi:F420-dependent oxidoreductase-like protein
MELGIHYADFGHPEWESHLVGRLVATARAADEGGAAWFTVMDHFLQMEALGGRDAPMLEGLTTLGHLSAVTSRVRLGLLVGGVVHRPPAVLAKAVTTLDVLSRGRALLGLGASWYEAEARAVGIPFPPLVERYAWLRESLELCRRMLAGDASSYAGEHVVASGPVNLPAPVGDVPIVVGGSGERRTLRLVAEHADACNLWGEGPERVRHKLSVLRAHCDDVGRSYDDVRKTVILHVDPLADRQAFLAEMAAYANLGISLVVLSPQGDDPVAWTSTVCDEVLPELQRL